MAKQKINAYQNGGFFEELARTTLVGGAVSITASFTAKKYLRIYVLMIPSGATLNPGYQYNGDTGSNYSSRLSANGAADSAPTSQTMNFLDVAGPQTLMMYSVLDVINVAAQEKITTNIATTVGAAGAATSPTRREQVQKWANTSNAITSIAVLSNTGNNFAAGSEVVVTGHD